MNFVELVAHIADVDGAARLAAGRSLQQILSLRNWLIGASVVEFEQAGEDRAGYGQRLMAKLSRALADAGCQSFSASNLKNCRQVTLAYPGLDAAGLDRRLAFSGPLFRQTSGETKDATGIRQTSGESGREAAIVQTSAPSPGTPFPSLARRALEHTDQTVFQFRWSLE